MIRKTIKEETPGGNRGQSSEPMRENIDMNILAEHYSDAENNFQSITTYRPSRNEFIDASNIEGEPWRIWIADKGDEYTVAEARKFLAGLAAAISIADEKNREAAEVPNVQGEPTTTGARNDPMKTLAAAQFDGGIITADIVTSDGGKTFEADIQFEGGGVMTAAEYREAADQYESFPTWLRAFADVVDAITQRSN